MAVFVEKAEHKSRASVNESTIYPKRQTITVWPAAVVIRYDGSM